MRSGSWLGVVTLLLLAPPALPAQEPARSFDQLEVLISAGDTVTVTDGAGREVRGRLLRLAAEAMTLEVDGREATWERTDVRLIRHGWSDPVLNGVLIGAAVGAGTGIAWVTWWCASTKECHSQGAATAAEAAVGAGIGAGIGALADSLHRAQRTVYESPARSAGRSVAVVPMLSPARRGVALNVRF